MTKTELFSDGEAYERLMGRWSRIAGREFLDWLALPKRLRWLDIGCGNGAFTEEIVSRAGPQAVAAIDPSAEQIAFARKRAGAAMAEFEVGGAEALAFADDSFDAAVMALVLAFVRDPAKAVAEMARVVRPGGTVANYMWDIEGGGSPVTPVYAAIASLGMAEPQRANPEASRLDAMRGLWQAAGLADIEARVVRVTISFSGFDDFWDSVSVPVGPQGKAIAAMTPEMRGEVRERLRERMPAAADGRIEYAAFANAVKGRVPGKSPAG
jgi:ubiquinone/menaquinone biosynthesis C-methylase UbiE